VNPLSSDLDAMRQTLLYSGLEAIAYNQNRRSADLKFYEFGKVYSTKDDKYIETQRFQCIHNRCQHCRAMEPKAKAGNRSTT
jgi:phenylalanyl-tRNA synthetase beta subunit